MTTVKEAVFEWVEELNAKYGTANTVYSVQVGKVYYRIVRSTFGSSSAYGFVDKTGDVWKAASWKAPAKNFSRGNVISDRRYPEYSVS